MAFAFDPRSDLPLVLGGNVFGWSADRDASFAVLDAFLDAGGSQLDTADGYAGGQSETIIGDWLAARGCRRWLAQQPGVLAPIASARTTEQLAELVLVGQFSLADTELAALRAAAD